MKTILLTAYAINPYKGSEDGMGWNFVLQAARHQRVIAVTRRNNRPHIERYLSEHTIAQVNNITFLYFDLPAWTCFWKKGPTLSLIYFYMADQSSFLPDALPEAGGYRSQPQLS